METGNPGYCEGRVDEIVPRIEKSLRRTLQGGHTWMGSKASRHSYGPIDTPIPQALHTVTNKAITSYLGGRRIKLLTNIHPNSNSEQNE